MCKLFSWTLFVGILFTSILPMASFSALAEETPLRVLIDVRSNHSDGAHDFNTLADLAQKRGIDVLAFTEHDRLSILLGIEPIPKILGYEHHPHPSLYTTGVKTFFSDLAIIRQQRPDMLFMAGIEALPGLKWSGLIPRGDMKSPLLYRNETNSLRYHYDNLPALALILHNPEKHMIALGVERPEQIYAMPSFTLEHSYGSLAMSMVFWWLVVGVMLIILLRRKKRAVALLLFASFIAFQASWLMIRAKPVDEDAHFIQAAKAMGLFTIWAHPGVPTGLRPSPLMGLIVDMPKYRKRVFREPTADAFAGVYGDTDDSTKPGGLWDDYMIDYMAGLHTKPIWVASSGDYHKEGQAHEYLGNFPMDVWVEERSLSGVLAAMRKGHMVAWRTFRNQNFRVKMLSLKDASGKLFLPGDEAVISGDLSLHFLLQEQPVSGRAGLPNKPISVRLIVDGKVLKVAQTYLNRPMKVRLHLTPGDHVVRLDVPMQWLGWMVANPFLLHVKD